MNVAVTAFSLAVTLGAYVLSLLLRRRIRSSLLTPILVATAIVIAVITGMHVTYASYQRGGSLITLLIGPATVAMAVPIYKHRAVLAANLVPALAGMVAGSISTLLVAVAIAQVFGLPRALVESMSVKSTTIPIAVELARTLHANPALTALFVIATGMLGGVFGLWLLDLARIRHPLARGLSLGTIAHGSGIAQAMLEGELPGAIAGAAMGSVAIFMSVVAPYLVPLVVR